MLNGLINYIPAIKYGNLVDNAEINPAISQSTTITLTSAQIKTLNSVPTTVVTTTTTGTVIVPQSLVWEMNGTTTTYTSGGVVNLVYHGATTNLLAVTIPASVVTTSSAGVLHQYETATSNTLTANTGVDIYAATGDFTTGTGTAVVTLNYYIVTL